MFFARDWIPVFLHCQHYLHLMHQRGYRRPHFRYRHRYRYCHLPMLTTEDDNSDSDGDDENEDDGTPADTLNEDSVGDEETPVSSPVQRTLSGRVTRNPNSLIPIMTGKSHGKSRDQGVNFPLVGNYHPDNDRDSIYCTYAGAGYKTNQGVVHFNVGDDTPHLRP